MIGVIQTGIALLRLGDLTRYISHAVIVGFTAGAAMLLVLDQTKNLLGFKSQGGPHDHFLVRLWLTISNGGPIHRETLMLGVGTILFVLALGWVNRRMRWRIPELLLGVAIAATIVWAFQLDRPLMNQAGDVVRDKVAVIGEIPRSLPTFDAPTFNWDLARQLSGSALAIALLGLLEAMAMAKAIAARTQQKLDMNQQCLSEGVANTVGSFFQCYAGSGSLTRSAINHQAGALTQWSGVISAIAVAVTMLLFAPYARYIPKAALAGVLMVSAFRMVDSHKLAYHLRVTRMDAAIVLATAVSAVAISVEFCILIGVFLSFLIYLPRAAKVSASQLVVTPEQIIRERRPDDPLCNRLLIYDFEGELFFGASPDFDAELTKIHNQARKGIKVVVLRLKNARNLDGVCLDLLLDHIDRMAAEGITVLLCGVRSATMVVLQNAGLEEKLGPERIFPERAAVWSSTTEAIAAAYKLLGDDVCGTCPARPRGDDAGPWYSMI
jgi:SulP family sulfate permease